MKKGEKLKVRKSEEKENMKVEDEVKSDSKEKSEL